MTPLINLEGLKLALNRNELSPWYEQIVKAINKSKASQHGKINEWAGLLNGLFDVSPVKVDLSNGVSIFSDQLSVEQCKALKQQLLKLAPWRKGPFNLFNIHIDAEWRSDYKWQRISGKVCFINKTILDVGCGNGYYMFRMLGAGAKYVIGIDPVPLYVMQFNAIQKYVRTEQLQLLPLTLEELPVNPVFDTVFSMGVLYHRRIPLDHLIKLKKMMQANGELILESLVIKGRSGDVLIPENRYAGMNNVWSIPSIQTLKSWLDQTGFVKVEVLDCTAVTLDEQRQSEWMTTYSLNQFIDPLDCSRTIEGYPAPIRAILKCQLN